MSDTYVPSEVTKAESAHKPKGRGWLVFVLIFGVILPIVSITVELWFRICTSMFFDPIPTAVHLVLLSLAPLTGLTVLLLFRTKKPAYSAWLPLLLGLSIGTGVAYSLQFLPLLPVSLMGIMALGIGACGLSPYFGLWAAIVCNRHVGQIAFVDQRRHGRLTWLGIVLSSAVLLAYVGSTYATDIGLRMAESADEAKSARGVRLIRDMGNDAALLRACYGLPTGIITEMDTWFDPQMLPNRDEAREVYYRVTGRPFNSVPPPRLVGFRSDWTEDFSFDNDVGGTAVSQQNPDVGLCSSRMDASIDPDGLCAYTEWTLVFTNQAEFTQREARAEIALPPGGVVSRLTLWINGEEREAAFGSRGQVRAAYQEVAVVQRRDPVLVTTCGPDHVLMQCFPIPPNGGKMKVRIGITSPLALEDAAKAVCVLPHFIERNFGIEEGVKHSLFIESANDMSVAGRSPSTVFSGMLPDSDLVGDKGSIICSRNPSVRLMWSPDKFDPKSAIVQEIAPARDTAPEQVVIVVDGSSRLGRVRRDIADALEKLPSNCRFAVLLAGDEMRELVPMQNATPEAIRKAQNGVQDARYVGGIDNRAALIRAYDIALQNPRTAVLWIHGPQPLDTEAHTEQIIQRWEHRPNALRLYTLAAVDGRNSILSDLERTGIVTVVPRRGKLSSDMERVLTQWSDKGGDRLATKLIRVPIGSVQGAARVSSNLCRLWARDEVRRMCMEPGSRKLQMAAALASRYQLVTPVSGAVVLETAEQYKRAGLKPVDPAKVQAVTPEPSSWIALATGMALLGYIYLRRQRASISM